MTVRVRVPCSTSNLGAGFDCIGVALDWWMEAELVEAPARTGVSFERSGTLHGVAHAAGDDLLWRGYRLACAARGTAIPPDIRFRVHSEIPVARGLGSSAAALVGGALLANAAHRLELSDDECVALCAGVEGHPDNVAPIVLGGAVLAVPRETGAVTGSKDGGYTLRRIPVHEEIGFAACVPAFETSTKEARALLPASLPYRTGVMAAAKAAALVHGLATADGDLLRAALDDVLHVPFRRAMLPAYDDVVRAAMDAGAWGATLSGSGSTLVALAPRGETGAVAVAMALAWEGRGIAATGRAPQIAAGASTAPGDDR